MTQLSPRSTTLVRFEGALEPHEWEKTRDTIVAAADGATSAVVLDLSAVTFFGSHAVRALLAARDELEPRGVTIHLGCCSRIVRSVVEITGLDQEFPPPPPPDL